jgi:hypothetical protein
MRSNFPKARFIVLEVERAIFVGGATLKTAEK